MKELLVQVNDRISEMIDDGTIKKMIDERATKAVTEILDETFRSYGKLRKSLQEKIENSIDGSTFSFEIEPYTKVMSCEMSINHHNYCKTCSTCHDCLDSALNKADIYEKALIDIIKHWETMAPEAKEFSAVWHIATRALENKS